MDKLVCAYEAKNSSCTPCGDNNVSCEKSLGSPTRENSSSSPSHNEKRCKICGARASGNHYGCLSCEGCKAFFRRGSAKGIEYRCFLGGLCLITESSRDRCKACRFKKCISEGMVLNAPSSSAVRGTGRKPCKSSSPKHSDKSSSLKEIDVSTGKFGDQAAGTIPHSQISLNEQKRYDVVPSIKTEPSCSPTLQDLAVGKVEPDGISMSSSSPTSTSSNEAASPISLYSPSQTPTDQEDSLTFHQLMAKAVQRAQHIVPKSSTNENFSLRMLTESGFYTQGIFSRDPLSSRHANGDSVQCLDNIRIFLEKPAVINFPRDDPLFVAGNFCNKLNLDEIANVNSFMTRYWTLIKRDNGSVQCTVKGVDELVRNVYLDEIEYWTGFMNKVFTSGVKPIQPQTSLDRMVKLFQSNTKDEVERHNKFCSLLPGFYNLTINERLQRLRQRGCHVWLIRHAKFIHKREMYFLTVEEDIHYCRYWTEQLLDQDLMDYLFTVAEEINALDLTITETYFLLAVALFWRDASDEKAEHSTDFFYKHYLDILILLIGTRRPDALDRLQNIIAHFTHIQRLQLEYILTLDCSHAPFLPRQGMPFHTVRQILASDPTKPSPNTDWHVL